MSTPVVRHFRQIVLWPLQLMPVAPGQPVQDHWRFLPATGPWRPVIDEFDVDGDSFQERHYKEFVTFLPFAQRFLYGSATGQESSRRVSNSSLHVFRRHDVAAVRIVLAAGAAAWRFEVAHVDLYFFADADVAMLAFELHADDLPLDVAQDVLFRFGRAYPAFWERDGAGGNCPHRVEWLGADGGVLSASDYDAREKYLRFVREFRSSAIAAHWEWLMRPLLLEYPGQGGTLRFRQLEYYRMPFLAYLAVDDPRQLTRADFVRLGLVTRPGRADELPYAEGALADFESRYCDDRFWGRSGDHYSGDTRLVVTGTTLAFVGAAGDTFYSGRETGLLGQFRHQYFLLFLVAHFQRAALLSMADELAVAMDRLRVGEVESVKRFKRTIRQQMEAFLRFTHRYWFHAVSNQALARSVFDRLRTHLGTDGLYAQVRNEVVDMNEYLDSDSARRQANTLLRLTVVTIAGLVGTIVTGFLGMNLLAEADEPLSLRVLLFAITVVVVAGLTLLTIAKSKRLADLLDVLSDERRPIGEKWRALAGRNVRASWWPKRDPAE